MSIAAPRRPRRCKVFGRIIFWGCLVTHIQNRRPFQRQERYGCGLDDHLRMAPQEARIFSSYFWDRTPALQRF